jgi:hypothetical protein
LIVIALFGAALAASHRGNARTAFGWLYLPTLFLVPIGVAIQIPGLPDITAARAGALGILIGALASGRLADVLPRWRWFDLLPLFATVSFSISFGLGTEPMGFVHRIVVLGFDWFATYCLARGLVRTQRDLRPVLPPVAVAVLLLALLSGYEARMGSRLALELWHALGIPIEGCTFHDYRQGYLRAAAHLSWPISLGTVFATATPLVVLLGAVSARARPWSMAIAVLGALGCVSALSRGPILALAFSLAFFAAAARWPRGSPIVLLLALAASSPTVFEWAREAASYTMEEIRLRGNIDSGHYRVALLMLYATRIGELGWWGDPSIVGDAVEAAWSIDNAYLYLFIAGGWLGGGAFVAMTGHALLLGYRRVLTAKAPHRRRIAAWSAAAFAAMAACLADVWFAPDFAPLYWLCLALVLNVGAARRGTRTAARRLARGGRGLAPPACVPGLRAGHTGTSGPRPRRDRVTGHRAQGIGSSGANDVVRR